eukprot:5338934-Pleurochrysis_carterae.AAC.4
MRARSASKPRTMSSGRSGSPSKFERSWHTSSRSRSRRSSASSIAARTISWYMSNGTASSTRRRRTSSASCEERYSATTPRSSSRHRLPSAASPPTGCRPTSRPSTACSSRATGADDVSSEGLPNTAEITEERPKIKVRCAERRMGRCGGMGRCGSMGR